MREKEFYRFLGCAENLLIVGNDRFIKREIEKLGLYLYLL